MTEKRRDYRCFGETMRGTVLLTGEANIFYFTGFHTTAKRPKQIGPTAVLLSGDRKRLICPGKWQMQIEEMNLSDPGELVVYGNTQEAYERTLKKLLEEADCTILWVEYPEISVPLYQKLLPVAGEIRDITPAMEQIRLFKSPDEIRKLREAADIAAEAMEYSKRILKPGIRERDAGAEIEWYMRKKGSDGVPFTMKLLSGENSAVVTRVPGERRLQKGDLVLLDFGAKKNGYSSDWTRTFCLGEPSEVQQEIYDLVWKIQRSCIERIKPGCTLEELTACASNTARESRLGIYYQPHLGHSVGITSHEPPIIEPGASGTLKEHMVITVEPGIYVPGVGGVRIEDEILVTKDGYEILTGLKEEGLMLPV